MSLRKFLDYVNQGGKTHLNSGRCHGVGQGPDLLRISPHLSLVLTVETV